MSGKKVGTIILGAPILLQTIYTCYYKQYTNIVCNFVKNTHLFTFIKNRL